MKGEKKVSGREAIRPGKAEVRTRSRSRLTARPSNAVATKPSFHSPSPTPSYSLLYHSPLDCCRGYPLPAALPRSLPLRHPPLTRRHGDLQSPYLYTTTTIMGGSLSRLWSLIWTKKEIRILILGLVRTRLGDWGNSPSLGRAPGLGSLRETSY